MTLKNTRLQKHLNDPFSYMELDACRKYGDSYVWLQAEGDLSAFPTDYSASMEEVLEKPGIHVWIFMAEGQFAAARTRSVYETLSKHQDLYLKYNKSPVIAAGECQIGPDKDVVYNFQSGSFMLGIMESYKKHYPSSGNYTTFYEPWMTDLWFQHGAKSVQFRAEPSLISEDTVPLTEEVVRNYMALGVKGKVFPSKQACIQYKSYHSQIGQIQRDKAREQYNRVQKFTKKSFEEWAESAGFGKLFAAPPEAANLRGGTRKRRVRR